MSVNERPSCVPVVCVRYLQIRGIHLYVISLLCIYSNRSELLKSISHLLTRERIHGLCQINPSLICCPYLLCGYSLKISLTSIHNLLSHVAKRQTKIKAQKHYQARGGNGKGKVGILSALI